MQTSGSDFGETCLGDTCQVGICQLGKFAHDLAVGETCQPNPLKSYSIFHLYVERGKEVITGTHERCTQT